MKNRAGMLLALQTRFCSEMPATLYSTTLKTASLGVIQKDPKYNLPTCRSSASVQRYCLGAEIHLVQL